MKQSDVKPFRLWPATSGTCGLHEGAQRTLPLVLVRTKDVCIIWATIESGSSIRLRKPQRVSVIRVRVINRVAHASARQESCPVVGERGCRMAAWKVGLGVAPSFEGTSMPHFLISSPNRPSGSWKFPDADVFVIGRADTCTLHLPDPGRRVSKSHAAVVRVPNAPGQYFIRDLGSRASTRVSGDRIYQRILRDNDTIEIADYRLLFRTGEGATAAVPRLRFVRSTDDDGVGGETIASPPLPAASCADAAGQEIIEQLARHAFLGETSASLFSEWVERLFRYLQADRGFVAQLSSGQEYSEVAVLGLHPNDQIDVADSRCIDKLINGETVHDGTIALVPIVSPDGVRGFFCLERRGPRARPFSSDNTTFLRLAAELVVKLWKPAFPSHLDHSGDVVAWPAGLVGCSRLMDALRLEVARAAKSSRNVLVFGETGTGKELVAKALYSLACDATAPYVDRCCATIPESLAATELFGSEKGAFTGAERTTKGWFEIADGGALLLDDIQGLPHSVRPALYRVLHEKRVVRVGSSHPKPVDVFVIGTFETKPGDGDGGDLFERAFFERFPQRITVPSLRDRKEDIPLLIFYFLDGCAARESKRTRSVSHQALELLMKYDWPGNVRELRNCIENAVKQDVEIVLSSDLPPYISTSAEPSPPSDPSELNAAPAPSRLKTLAEIEKEAILTTLRETGGNIVRSARALGIAEMTVRNKMKAYNIPAGYGRNRV